MHHWTETLTFGHGGLVVAALAALLWVTRSGARIPTVAMPAAIYTAVLCAALPLLADFVLSTWYLLSPTYLDHIEASVASTAQYFLQGVAVYPRLDSYTFHGLLYGPLLPELNSLGYFVAGGALGAKLVGWASAWLAIALILVTPRRSERDWTWVASVAAPCYILASFGSVLTADRADSLLLLCASTALWSVLRLPRLPGLLLAALLAGAAADLKVHGPAYMLPALWLWITRHRDQGLRDALPAAIAATAAAAAGVLLPFAPTNVSWVGYLSYLELGARHGLNFSLLGWNFAFLLSLWIPALLVASTTPGGRPRAPRGLVTFSAILLVTESAVAVIASKPGAGPHHLLPFVGFHAFLMQRLLKEAQSDSERSWPDLPAARATVIALAAVLIGTAPIAALALRQFLNFDLQLPSQEATLAELTRFTNRYPHGMMGIAGTQSYELTSFRPWLTLTGTRQTDYGAWMDWNLSGVSDAPLAHALQVCEIPYLFVPKGGDAFSMINNYGGPLFSAAVRYGFGRYSLIESGTYFDVFGCARRSYR